MYLKITVSTSDTLNGIRCLKAAEHISKGEVIEECPVILLPEEQIDHVAETLLTHYEFLWDDKNEAIALGYGSLYNHSHNPNVTFSPNYDKKVMVFTALRDIAPDEELLLDYQLGDTSEKIDPEYVNFLY
jgi:uncharacterized protein